MTVKKIVTKTPRSLQACEAVNDFEDCCVQQAAQDLLDTLAHQQLELDKSHPRCGAGVGLAANQIDCPFDMYVVSVREVRAELEECKLVEPTVYINARFIPDSQAVTKLGEACLSIAGFQGLSVPRFESGVVKAFDRHGHPIKEHVSAFIARVHQHEIDHGAGKEYLNHMAFSSEELLDIRAWVDRADFSEVILPGRLLCPGGESVDVDSLLIWVEGEMSRRTVENGKKPLA